MKYYLIAGEASGDLHASNLMKALKETDKNADFRFWGGDLMTAQGGNPVKHYRELAFMGFAEVLMNLPTILKNISFCKEDILNYKPDAIIFIDYPGFNMRIAEWARKEGFQTHYYISPQIWAWKENRIKKIRRDVDYMYVILPFEEEFYSQKHNFPVHFVGHPLLDAIENRPPLDIEKFKNEHDLDDRPIIALLPGSRKQEIEKMLKIMLSITEDFREYQFIIAGAPSQDINFYHQFIKKSNVNLVMNKTYDVLTLAHAALVTSGTATLETALFKVPEVVCYKGNFISYHIAKQIINLDYISLVNLIMKREVVKELIQNDLNTKNLTSELKKILDDTVRQRIFRDYYELEQKLGGQGASKKTANLIYNKVLASKNR
ncbi:lipid-A-disaccharide synthase [Christiangramia fulva]|uniref:Lipid-A-disaccharide synthase n=1 Tax=Christiangramia fulva TaxID=2126553 RepID=A0A2R3Z228_9FLAO|nr:lipid-A-disaccharide synthase [Christiangramia fulva]AVR44314.1 lipid-A-disaccharide synthase [Christiangramia fulva]